MQERSVPLEAESLRHVIPSCWVGPPFFKQTASTASAQRPPSTKRRKQTQEDFWSKAYLIKDKNTKETLMQDEQTESSNKMY